MVFQSTCDKGSMRRPVYAHSHLACGGVYPPPFPFARHRMAWTPNFGGNAKGASVSFLFFQRNRANNTKELPVKQEPRGFVELFTVEG